MDFWLNSASILQGYWQVICFIGAIIVYFIVQRGTIKEMEDRISVLENDYKEVVKSQSNIDLKLTSIQADLVWIKNSLMKHD